MTKTIVKAAAVLLLVIYALTPSSAQIGAGAVAPTNATYITQTANSSLSAEQALSSLSTGLMKVTTGTGVLSTATAGTDYLSASNNSQITCGSTLLYNVKCYGAAGDTRMVKDAALNGTTTVTSATASFTAADIGKIIYGVQTSSGLLRLPRGTVTAVGSSTSITVSIAATGTYTGVWLVLGTDDSDAIRTTVAAAYAASPSGQVVVPPGGYLFKKVPFDISNPGGSGAATREPFSVQGGGSNTTVFFMDPTFDFATTASNQGAFVKNSNGANIQQFKMRGVALEGASYTFSGTGYYGAQFYCPKAEYDDVRIMNVRGFSAAAYALGNQSLFTRFHLENASYTGISVTSGMTFVQPYVGNNGNVSMEVTGVDVSANASDPLTIVGGVIDESTSGALQVKTNSTVVLVGATVYGAVSQYAVTIDGTSTVKAFGSLLTPFSASGNRSGVSVASGGKLYMSGSVTSKNGSGTALNNSGSVYDMGGNTFGGGGVTGTAPIAPFTASLQPGGYKSSDGTAGVTVTTCTSFKDGLCVAGT